MKKSLLAIAFSFVLVWVTPCLGGGLRIVTLSQPPYAFMEGDVVVGLAVDVVREGLNRAGFHAVEIEIVPWKRALLMVKEGEADAIFNAVKTPEREEYLLYSEELLLLEETVALRKAGSAAVLRQDLTQAMGIRLGVGSGFSYGETLDNALHKSTFAKLEGAPTIARNIEKLLAGRIDILLADTYPALYAMKLLGVQSKVEILKDERGHPIVYGSSKSYLAFSRRSTHPSIAERFSEALKGMKQDGTFQEITEKYR